MPSPPLSALGTGEKEGNVTFVGVWFFTNSCSSHSLPAPPPLESDPIELTWAWQEVPKGFGEKSSMVEHAVLTVRAFAHTCPIKNVGPSEINYIAALTVKWKEMLCVADSTRLLLGALQMHLAWYMHHGTVGLTCSFWECSKLHGNYSACHLASFLQEAKCPCPASFCALGICPQLSFFYSSSWRLETFSVEWLRAQHTNQLLQDLSFILCCLS